MRFGTWSQAHAYHPSDYIETSLNSNEHGLNQNPTKMVTLLYNKLFYLGVSNGSLKSAEYKELLIG